MASTDTSTSALPPGTWKLDPVHSFASFRIKHMIVGTYRGHFEHVDATLTVPEGGKSKLEGIVDVSSLKVKDENLIAHLTSPDFFDVERYKDIKFLAEDLRLDGDRLISDGHLTIKGETHHVEARGTFAGPAVALGDQTKIGIELETVIDRTQFDLAWNAPLPKGGFALGDEVKLTVELEFVLAS